MSKANRMLLVVGVAALCISAFYLGRYAERLRMSASGCSYRAFILEGMLRQLRAGKVPKVGIALETRLDEEVATLARIRRARLPMRAFVPARYREQVEVVLRRFIDYRSTAASKYKGTPLWQIERFEKPTRELLDELESMNEKRTQINALVKSVYEELGGREAPPAPPEDSSKGKPAQSAGTTNNPPDTPAETAP